MNKYLLLLSFLLICILYVSISIEAEIRHNNNSIYETINGAVYDLKNKNIDLINKNYKDLYIAIKDNLNANE